MVGGVGMMEASALILTALWLGILTSVSPCPLATNIAAVSFLSRRIGRPWRVVLGGVLYTAGRMTTYAVLGVLLVESLLGAPVLSHFLQRYLNRLIGPLLIVVGMFLLDLLRWPAGRGGIVERLQGRFSDGGLLGTFLLGALFALSFCPISAAIFFGSLIPLAMASRSGILVPSLYGIGTGIPVLAVSLVTILGLWSLGTVFQRISTFERWARPTTGVVFVLVGIHLALTYNWGLFS